MNPSTSASTSNSFKKRVMSLATTRISTRRLSANYDELFQESSSVDRVGEHFDLSGEHVNLEEERVKLAKLYHKARQDIDCARHSRETTYHESDMEEAKLAVLECAEHYEMIAKITNNRPAQNIKLLWEKPIKNLRLMLSAIENDKKFTSLLLEIEGDKNFKTILLNILNDEDDL